MNLKNLSSAKSDGIKIPKKGKKIFGNLFIRRLKRLTFVYDAETGVRLLCVASKEWTDESLVNYVNDRKNELEALMQKVWIFNDDGTITIGEEPRG